MIRKYWLGILGLVLVVIAVVLAVTVPQPVSTFDKFLNALLVSMGWAVSIFQFFYNHSEKFYVQVSSLRMWFTNEPVKWNFTIEFLNCSHSSPLDSTWQVISQRYRKAVRWHQDISTLIVNMPGYTIRAFIPDTASPIEERIVGRESTSVQISDLELPFRTFKTKIENEIIPLIKDIAELVQPTDEKYAAKVSFSSQNPYFGFFVRKLELPKVVSFACDIIEDSIGGHKQSVTVRKDRIEIVTDDLLALQSLSLKYVALTGT